MQCNQGSDCACAQLLIVCEMFQGVFPFLIECLTKVEFDQGKILHFPSLPKVCFPGSYFILCDCF